MTRGTPANHACGRRATYFVRSTLAPFPRPSHGSSVVHGGTEPPSLKKMQLSGLCFLLALQVQPKASSSLQLEVGLRRPAAARTGLSYVSEVTRCEFKTLNKIKNLINFLKIFKIYFFVHNLK
jgi:hypothetical protein